MPDKPVHVFFREGEKIEIECVKSGPYSEDCQHCNKILTAKIEEWINATQAICLLCDENPKCYFCLKQQCVDWCANENFIEDYGTHRGCPSLRISVYCSDFYCKHGVPGWWMRDWKKELRKKKKKLKNKLREDFIKRQKRKERENAKRKKPKTRKKKSIKTKTVRRRKTRKRV